MIDDTTTEAMRVMALAPTCSPALMQFLKLEMLMVPLKDQTSFSHLTQRRGTTLFVTISGIVTQVALIPVEINAIFSNTEFSHFNNWNRFKICNTSKLSKLYSCMYTYHFSAYCNTLSNLRGQCHVPMPRMPQRLPSLRVFCQPSLPVMKRLPNAFDLYRVTVLCPGDF